MGKCICFTGHRPDKLGGYEGEKALAIQVPLQERLIDIVRRAIEGGFDTFISGGAIGVDQMGIEAVLHHKRAGAKIKLVIAKPFPSQGSKWPPHVQARFENYCNAADEVVDVSPDPYDREKMQVRNEWMVDRSEAVIAVYNGGRGGTGNCVAYARKQYMAVLAVNPYTLVEKWEMNKKARW